MENQNLEISSTITLVFFSMNDKVRLKDLTSALVRTKSKSVLIYAIWNAKKSCWMEDFELFYEIEDVTEFAIID